MARTDTIAVGARVRLRSASHVVTLRGDTGEVIRPDVYDGYYVIRLDEPALYHEPDGTIRELPEIVELAANLVVLTSAVPGVRVAD